MISRFAVMLFTLVLLSTSQSSFADIAIVTHPQTSIASISIADAESLFLGRKSNVDGIKLQPIDLSEEDITREQFYLMATKKTASQLNAYWSRLVFTGKGYPPKQLIDADEVIELISSEPGYIGYIPYELITDELKVLQVLKN